MVLFSTEGQVPTQDKPGHMQFYLPFLASRLWSSDQSDVFSALRLEAASVGTPESLAASVATMSFLPGVNVEYASRRYASMEFNRLYCMAVKLWAIHQFYVVHVDHDITWYDRRTPTIDYDNREFGWFAVRAFDSRVHREYDRLFQDSGDYSECSAPINRYYAPSGQQYLNKSKTPSIDYWGSLVGYHGSYMYLDYLFWQKDSVQYFAKLLDYNTGLTIHCAELAALP